MRLRPRPRLRARAKDRSMDRKPLSLRCDPEQYSTLLWPPVTCNHSYIRQELACYSWPVTGALVAKLPLYTRSTFLFMPENKKEGSLLSHLYLPLKAFMLEMRSRVAGADRVKVVEPRVGGSRQRSGAPQDHQQLRLPCRAAPTSFQSVR